MTTTKATIEFDQVFEDLKAPEYPATCDQCGVVETNASMENHACNEAPAPRAGERDEWRILETATRTSVINERGEDVAVGLGRNARKRREHAQQIVTEHNQHATLIEQRERLLRAVTLIRDSFWSENEPLDERINYLQNLAKETLAAIEQEGM